MHIKMKRVHKLSKYKKFLHINNKFTRFAIANEYFLKQRIMITLTKKEKKKSIDNDR